MSEFREGGPKFAPRELLPEEWAHSPWGDLNDKFNEDAQNAVKVGYLIIEREGGKIIRAIITEKGVEESHNKIIRGREIEKKVEVEYLEAHGNGKGNGKKKQNGNGSESLQEKSPTALLSKYPFMDGRYMDSKEGLTIWIDEKRDEVEAFFPGTRKEKLAAVIVHLHKKYGINLVKP